MPTLAEFWKSQPSSLIGKTFQQVITFAGDGRLLDGNRTSEELREWLSLIPLSVLRSGLEECLDGKFEGSPFALQDCTNEIGARLGYTIEHGLYRGKKGSTGNDGLWTASDHHAILVEVKTTDAYRINLDTLAGYREKLILDQRILPQKSSILIAVGREDTGDLEAQIRGSRHAWDIRLISLDALLRLAEVKEEFSDASTSNKIDQLLRPVEYTRVDSIVDLLFAAKKEIEANEPIVPPPEIGKPEIQTAKLEANIEEAREVAVRFIGEKLGCKFNRRGRATRLAEDGQIRLVCLASQRYSKSDTAVTYCTASRQLSADFWTRAYEVGWDWFPLTLERLF